MTGRTVEVEFVGGHMDGATVRLPANPRGHPPAELRMLPHPSLLPARWSGDGPPARDELTDPALSAVVTYRREPVIVGGLLIGWRMTATR